MKTRMFRQGIRIGAIGIVLAATGSLSAQSPRMQSIFSVRTPSNADSAEARQTIVRAIGQLEEGSEEERMAAAMLLEKYQTPDANDALREALDDPSVRVRRAALVSLVDPNRISRLSETRPIVMMLGDEDAEIRRQVSYYIGMLFSRMLYESSPSQRDAAVKIVAAAFDDEDVRVRRNMMKAYPNLRMYLPSSILLSGLEDPDREVRTQALRYAPTYLEPSVLAERSDALVAEDDPPWNQALARVLGNLEGFPVQSALERLAESEDQEVADEAAVALYRVSGRDPRGLPVFKRLLKGSLSRELEQKFVEAIGNRMVELKPRAEVFRAIVEEGSSGLRSAAISQWLAYGGTEVPLEDLLEFLDDNSQQVRRLVALRLLQRGDAGAEVIDAFVFNEHEDVRLMGFQLLSRLSEEERRNMLFDLMTDTSEDVRLRALRQIISRKIEGWQQIAGASLRDPSESFRKSVVDLLLLPGTSETESILRQFLKDEPDAALGPYIRHRLGIQGKEQT